MPAPNMSCQPPRNPEAKTHLCSDVCTTRDKQDNRPETTQKADPVIVKPETVSWVPFPLLLSTWGPFPIDFCFVSMFVSLDNLFPSVSQEPNLKKKKEPTFRP